MVDYSINHHDFQGNNERELEKFVGISVYSTSQLKGFGGIYKNTYKDFVVKEITSEGNILEIKEDTPITHFFEDSNYNYTTFNLIKINRDTFEVIRLLSKSLDIPIELINYSGLKDKVSLSIQQFSIKGNHIDRLKKFRYKDIFIRNIIPTKKSVKIGSNWGNNFTITLRKIDPEKSSLLHIQKILKIVQEKGFPNYYGLQRFGTFRPNSHLVGRYILEGNFKEAFDEIVLNTYSTENGESQKLRRELRKTGDYIKLYDKFPNSLNYEKILIKSIINSPGDYEKAVKKLPKYLIKLLISSFQSYLFNKLITLRVNRGLSLFQPENGDVISILDDEGGHLTKVKYIFGGAYDNFLVEAITLNRARMVIPLIGYDTKLEEFPLMDQLLRELLSVEGISLKIFENPMLVEYDFKGSYRSMIVKPIGLKLLEYEVDNASKKKNKLKLEFSLKRGSYATMLLRELMK